jgi:hypothetical protein
MKVLFDDNNITTCKSCKTCCLETIWVSTQILGPVPTRLNESVGSTISDSIPPSTRDPLSYCPDFPDILRQLELEGCGPMLVGNTIQTMVSKSSTDLDGISSKLLKSVRAEIERPLAHIFSLSLSAGIFPEQLKASRVIPIHKAGDTTNCDNYRPISLVNAFSKILKK